MSMLIRDLPNELIIIVGENLEIRDLASLILTSHRYHTLLRPLLRPRLLELAPQKEYAFTALFWSILTGDDEQAGLVLDKSNFIDIIKSPTDHPTHAAHIYANPRTSDLTTWNWIRRQGVKLVIVDNGGFRKAQLGCSGFSPLEWAIRSRHQGLLRLALENYEEKDINLLINMIEISIKEENIEAVGTLLADLKKSLGEAAWKRAHAKAVEMAIWYKQESLIKSLFAEDGADLNARDNLKRTALHLAVARPSEGPVKLLLDLGADVNAQEYFGRSPLHIACQLRVRRIVKLLLEYGADEDLKDIHGGTPEV